MLPVYSVNVEFFPVPVRYIRNLDGNAADVFVKTQNELTTLFFVSRKTDLELFATALRNVFNKRIRFCVVNYKNVFYRGSDYLTRRQKTRRHAKRYNCRNDFFHLVFSFWFEAKSI